MEYSKINNNFFLKLKYNQYIVFNNNSLEIFIYKGIPENYPNLSHDKNSNMLLHTSSEKGELEGILPSITICISEECNLACKYCYANGGNYNKLEKAIMSFTDLIFMFENLLNIYPKGIINYTFFGGEPMLGFKEIKRFIKYVTEESERRKLIKPHFAIVTNGTLINDNSWNVFNNYNFSVTVSLDGPKNINDQMRVYPNSLNSVYEIVKKNITSFGQRNFLLVAEATLSENYFVNYKPGTAKEYLDSFYELGFDSVSPFVAETKEMNINNKDFIKGLQCFYYDLVDYYFDLLLSSENFQRTPSYVISVIINILKKKSKKVCSAGKRSLFYTHNGDIFPCQMYYGDNSNRIGNINDLSDLQNNINNKKQVNRENIPECMECFAYRFCTMWCPGGAYLFLGAENQIDPVRCIVQKAIGEKIVYHLADVFDSNKKEKFIKNISHLSSHYSAAKYLGK